MILKKATLAALACTTLTSFAVAAKPGAHNNVIELSYDADIKTGMCSMTLTDRRTNEQPVTLQRPCDKHALTFVPAAKKEEYLKKYGQPKS